jgi:hypothetical protein
MFLQNGLDKKIGAAPVGQISRHARRLDALMLLRPRSTQSN